MIPRLLLLLPIALAACATSRTIADGSFVYGRLHAPPKTWSWIALDGMRCGTGAPTGIGLDHAEGARTLVVWLQGGGACWDADSCFARGGSAKNFEGYGREELRKERDLDSPILRRDEDGIVAEASHAFVPYCTGDLHAGRRVASHPSGDHAHVAHHVGGRNLDVALAALAATYPDVERVVLAGGSAGGLGVVLNLDRAAAAFPRAAVHGVDDAGPPVEPEPSRLAAWFAAWEPEPPAGCDACRTSLGAWLEHLARARPSSRLAILAYGHDAVFAAYADISSTELALRLDAMQKWMEQTPGQRLYLVDGFLHGVLETPIVRVNGLRPSEWVRAMLAGDPAWGNAR